MADIQDDIQEKESHKKRREHTFTYSLIRWIQSCPQNSIASTVMREQ